MMESRHLDRVIDFAAAILRRANAEFSAVKPTDFYNEGWLTTFALALAAQGVDLFPFRFAETAKWGRELLFRSSFKPCHRRDQRGVGTTHADAVVGHFNIRARTKRGIQLARDATQFVVIEAKIKSPLGSRTKNAEGFDQAARSVACMACEIEKAPCSLQSLTSLAFFVISAKQYVEDHRSLVTKESIREKVQRGIEQYEGQDRSTHADWYEHCFGPLLDQVKVECRTWEDIVEQAKCDCLEDGEWFDAFYQECLRLA
jgi:hypothetical protein